MASQSSPRTTPHDAAANQRIEGRDDEGVLLFAAALYYTPTMTSTDPRLGARFLALLLSGLAPGADLGVVWCFSNRDGQILRLHALGWREPSH